MVSKKGSIEMGLKLRARLDEASCKCVCTEYCTVPPEQHPLQSPTLKSPGKYKPPLASDPLLIVRPAPDADRLQHFWAPLVSFDILR